MNLIVLFSGQGLQTLRHYQELSRTLPAEAWQKLGERLPIRLKDEIEENALYDNAVAQPFIYALQYQRWQILQSLIDTPVALAGYSLGEATAFCCSGGLSFEQGLDLIQTRANVMATSVTQASGLLSVQGLSLTQLQQLFAQTDTYLSITLSPDKHIIGGYQPNLTKAHEIAVTMGAQSLQWLNVTIPSHTPLLVQATQAFSQYAQSLPPIPLSIPIISGTQGIKYDRAEQGFSLLAEQISRPLDWYLCMQTIQEYQPDLIIEIGPGNALTKMLSQVMPHIPSRSVDDFRDIAGLHAWITKNSPY